MTDQTLLIKIKADTDKAVAQVSKLTKEVDKLTKQNDRLSKKSKGIGDLNKSFSNLTRTLGAVGLGFSALGVAMAAVNFENMAEDAAQSADAFDKVFTDLGLSAESEFNKIKEASKGLISDASIKQSAVTAASLGVPVSKLSELMEVARAKAREMGTDAKSAFEDLAKGIGRGSPMILDNLGLTIKLGEANEKYAAIVGKSVDELTKQEKQIALTNAVLESGSESVKRFSDGQLSAKEETQKFNASLDNLKVKVGGALLKPMKELTIQTSDFIDSLDTDEVGLFTDAIKEMGNVLSEIKDSSFFETFKKSVADALGTGQVESAFEYAKAIYNVANQAYVLSENLENTAEKVDGVRHAFKNMEASKENLVALKNSTYELIQETEKLIKKYNESGSEKQKAAAIELTKELKTLGLTYSDLVVRIQETTEAEAKHVETVQNLSDSAYKELEKYSKERVQNHKSMISKLSSEEKSLTEDIEKAHKDLSKTLKGIAEDRFQTNFDLNNKIRDLEIGLLPETKQYAAKEKAEAEALANAKIAIKQGEYKQYEAYLSEYERLALDSANRITQGEGSTAATERQTAKAKIDILREIQRVEEEANKKKEADAKALHDLTVAQKETEIELVKAQIEAQKSGLLAMKEMFEYATGKKIDIDLTALDAIISKADTAQQSIKAIQDARVSINTDTTQLDALAPKVEQIKYATYNGITIPVKTDTTPADFGIQKLITKVGNDEISLTVNPEWDKAKKEIDDASRAEEKDPIEKPVIAGIKPFKEDIKKLDIIVKDIAPTVDIQANTDAVDKAKDRLEQPTNSMHVIDPDANKAIKAINLLRKPTSSTHTVYVREVYTRANGGLIPQKLATGGTFTGAGKVPGYDATDGDRVNAKLTGGEFVVKRSAVDAYGTSLLHSINNMSLPKFATGGQVGGAATQTELQPINLNIGGQSFKMMTDRDIAESLQRYIASEGGL